MDLFEQIMRIERAHYFIRTRSTGRPAELAGKLGISESQCYSVMKQMKEKLNAPVYYSRRECSYCYRRDVRFRFGFEPV